MSEWSFYTNHVNSFWLIGLFQESEIIVKYPFQSQWVQSSQNGQSPHRCSVVFFIPYYYYVDTVIDNLCTI